MRKHMSQPIVLLVDDDPDIRQVITFSLQRENFLILPAAKQKPFLPPTLAERIRQLLGVKRAA